MLKEMPLLRAPEKRRTGMEIKPKVRYPDQTEDAISSPVSVAVNRNRVRYAARVSLDYNRGFGCRKTGPVTQGKSTRNRVPAGTTLQVVVLVWAALGSISQRG